MPKLHKQQKPHKHAVIGPAPFLQKKSVVFTDVLTISGDSNAGSIHALMNGNGISVLTSAVADQIPQQALWNQYAAMFEYYQVTRISLDFMPFRFQGTTTTAYTTVFPSYSMLSPDSAFATSSTQSTQSAFFSFGNGRIVAPYAKNHREIADYTNLAICKQEETILKTNGSFTAREKYTNPASVQIYTNAPSFLAQIGGVMVYTLHYTFSGQKSPGVAIDGPNSQPQSEKWVPYQPSVMPMPVPTSTVQDQINQLMLLREKEQLGAKRD